MEIYILSIRDVQEPFPFLSPSIYAIDPPDYEAQTFPQKLVLAMVKENFSLNDLKCIPFGISLPIMEALRSSFPSLSLIILEI